MMARAHVKPLAARHSEELDSSILLVDDDSSQTEVLAYRLERCGYRTESVHSGGEAVQHALAHAPSLILLDLRLPDMSGFEVAQRLSDDPVTCSIPLIILSGMERPDIIRRCRASGCQYYVRKPYDPNALLILIRTALAEAAGW